MPDLSETALIRCDDRCCFRDPVLSGLLYQRTIPDSTPKEGRVQDGRGGGLTNEKLKREIQVKEERDTVVRVARGKG